MLVRPPPLHFIYQPLIYAGTRPNQAFLKEQRNFQTIVNFAEIPFRLLIQLRSTIARKLSPVLPGGIFQYPKINAQIPQDWGSYLKAVWARSQGPSQGLHDAYVFLMFFFYFAHCSYISEFEFRVSSLITQVHRYCRNFDHCRPLVRGAGRGEVCMPVPLRTFLSNILFSVF